MFSMRKPASKFLSLFLVLAMVCSLFGAAFAAEEETATPYVIPDVDGKVVILHTNDTHGYLQGNDKAIEALRRIVQAELTGGNLTLLHCLRSSVLECKHQSSILFMEDVGENLYSIDRMLQSLKLTDKFSKLQGLIVGDFTEMKGLNFGKDAYEIIQEVFADYAYPICFGFPAGHAENNFPLIIGSTIEMEISATGTTIHFQND